MDDARINLLKQEWTGKRVEIDPNAPTNRRFSGRIGTVVTVNMNARALVRFEETLDTGWFDLPIESLTVVAPAANEQHAAPAPPIDEAATAPELPPPTIGEPAAPSKRPSSASILEMARRQGSGKAKKSE